MCLWVRLILPAGTYTLTVIHDSSGWNSDPLPVVATGEDQGMITMPLMGEFPVAIGAGLSVNQYEVHIDGQVMGVAYFVVEGVPESPGPGSLSLIQKLRRCRVLNPR